MDRPKSRKGLVGWCCTSINRDERCIQHRVLWNKPENLVRMAPALRAEIKLRGADGSGTGYG